MLIYVEGAQYMKIKQWKRKLNVKHLGILLMVGILLTAGGFGIGKIVLSIFSSDADNYDKTTKKVGNVEHFTEENDQYHLSFYYPVYDIKVLDQTVSTYKKQQIMTNLKQDAPYKIEVDYDTKEVFNYIQLTFHQVVKDHEDKVIKRKDISYNYDKTSKKILRYDDVLRRDYLVLLKKLAVEHKVKEELIKKENLQNFQIEKDCVRFYFDHDLKISIPIDYAKNIAYIKLNNKDIPSTYQGEVLQPKPMKIDPTKPMIAITFDDGPHASNTAAIMTEFEKYGGRATFFMLGRNVKSESVDRSAIVKDMYQRGFELGNHSWDHSMAIAAKRKDFMSADDVSLEIFNTQDVIYQATGVDPTYFRPPYGAINDNVRAISTLDFALWDVDTNDWKNKNADSVADWVVQKAHDGAVVLIHDIHDSSAAAVNLFLPRLKEQGYQFVTMSTLMKYKGEDLSKEKVVIPTTSTT